MPPRTQEERELRRRLRKQLLAQGIDPETIDEAALMSIDPDAVPEPLMSEPELDVDVEVGEPIIQSGLEPEEALIPMGAPGPAAMADIAGTQEQEAALPPPMTAQEGMAPPEASRLEAQPMPMPDELPDVPAEDPVDEELAQRAGEVEAERGGAVRAANQGLAGLVQGKLAAAIRGEAKDPEKALASEEMMAGAGELEAERDEARLRLDEEREALQIARTATIKARAQAATEESLQLQEDIDQRARFEQEAQDKSAASTATVQDEYEKFKAMKVDPDRAMNEMSTGRKISFVLLGALGGIFRAAQADAGRAPTGPSVADTIVRRIDTLIKQDIAAQRRAIGQQEAVLGQAFKMDASVNKNLRDEGARLSASQALRWNALKSKLDAQLEKTDEPAKIAELGETRALVEQKEKNSWAESERAEARALYKESQYSALDIQTVQGERNFAARQRNLAADRVLKREDLAARREDRAASLKLRQEEAKRKGARETGVQERFEVTQGVKFEEKTAKGASQLHRYRRSIAGFSGPDAPTILERIAINKAGGFLPTGMSDASKKIYREFDDTRLRLIKEITGVAGRKDETDRIESVLANPSSTAAQIVDSMESAVEILEQERARKRVAFGPKITKRFEDVDAPSAETPAQEFKRKSRAGEAADRPPLRGR